MLSRKHNFKSSRLRARRRRAAVSRAVFALVSLATLWGFLFWFSSLGAFTVRNLEIKGVVSVSPSDLAKAAQKFLAGRYFFTVSRANIFFYPKSAIEADILRTFPRIERVAVGFENFHTIGLEVAERGVSALWCQGEALALTLAASGGERCYLLDDNGLIFAPFSAAATTSPAFIRFYSAVYKENPVGQTYGSAEDFRALSVFAKNLASLSFTASLFRERPDGDFEAKLLTGQRLIFSRAADFASVLNNFHTIVSDPGFSGTGGLAKVDYIDLRYGNKVFYKFK